LFTLYGLDKNTTCRTSEIHR